MSRLLLFHLVFSLKRAAVIIVVFIDRSSEAKWRGKSINYTTSHFHRRHGMRQPRYFVTQKERQCLAISIHLVCSTLYTSVYDPFTLATETARMLWEYRCERRSYCRDKHTSHLSLIIVNCHNGNVNHIAGDGCWLVLHSLLSEIVRSSFVWVWPNRTYTQTVGYKISEVVSSFQSFIE